MPQRPKTRHVQLLAALLSLPFIFIAPARAQNNPPAQPAPAPAANANVRVARLSRAEGDVGIMPAGGTAREQATANMPLQQGDTLSTVAGMAEVEFDDGATAYLNQNSQIELTQLAQTATGRQTEVTVKQGSATFSGSFSADDSFTVSTSTFQVTVPQNAEFRIDTLGPDGASVQVIQGSVTVTTKAGSVTLTQGQSVAVHQRDLDRPQAVGMAGPDNFDAWVASLVGVQLIGRNGEMRFWSPPVYYGYSDLATFGNWIDFPGLGEVWQPYTSENWQPYVNGAWRYRSHLGWTWVSFEPWGWLPYHYGTWHFGSRGWIWVPGAASGFLQWQPARVNWIRQGGQVAWVPMSPHDGTGESGIANLPQGIVTRMASGESDESASPDRRGNQVRVLDVRQLRDVSRLASPPDTFSAEALPPASQLETRTVAEYAQGVSSMVYDPQTRTFATAYGLPSNTMRDPRDTSPPSRLATPQAPNNGRSAPVLLNPNLPLVRQLGLNSRPTLPRLPAQVPASPTAPNSANRAAPGTRVMPSPHPASIPRAYTPAPRQSQSR